MANWTADQQREHRKLWVEALRSGKYRQTTGCLHDVDGFCCLGVACDISKVGEWETDKLDHLYVVGDEVDSMILPTEVQAWLGLRTTGGEATRIKLWRLNDTGTTFARIADIIEAEPEGLIAAPPEAA